MKAKNKQDQQKCQTIMWNCDIMQHIVLDQAIKHSDVGLMEDMLLQLLFQFMGGRNSNYATEVVELFKAYTENGLQKSSMCRLLDYSCNTHFQTTETLYAINAGLSTQLASPICFAL